MATEQELEQEEYDAALKNLLACASSHLEPYDFETEESIRAFAKDLWVVFKVDYNCGA